MSFVVVRSPHHSFLLLPHFLLLIFFLPLILPTTTPTPPPPPPPTTTTTPPAPQSSSAVVVRQSNNTLPPPPFVLPPDPDPSYVYIHWCYESGCRTGSIVFVARTSTWFLLGGYRRVAYVPPRPISWFVQCDPSFAEEELPLLVDDVDTYIRTNSCQKYMIPTQNCGWPPVSFWQAYVSCATWFAIPNMEAYSPRFTSVTGKGLFVSFSYESVPDLSDDGRRESKTAMMTTQPVCRDAGHGEPVALAMWITSSYVHPLPIHGKCEPIRLWRNYSIGEESMQMQFVSRTFSISYGSWLPFGEVIFGTMYLAFLMPTFVMALGCVAYCVGCLVFESKSPRLARCRRCCTACRCCSASLWLYRKHVFSASDGTPFLMGFRRWIRLVVLLKILGVLFLPRIVMYFVVFLYRLCSFLPEDSLELAIVALGYVIKALVLFLLNYAVTQYAKELRNDDIARRNLIVQLFYSVALTMYIIEFSYLFARLSCLLTFKAQMFRLPEVVVYSILVGVISLAGFCALLGDLSFQCCGRFGYGVPFCCCSPRVLCVLNCVFFSNLLPERRSDRMPLRQQESMLDAAWKGDFSRSLVFADRILEGIDDPENIDVGTIQAYGSTETTSLLDYFYRVRSPIYVREAFGVGLLPPDSEGATDDQPLRVVDLIENLHINKTYQRWLLRSRLRILEEMGYEFRSAHWVEMGEVTAKDRVTFFGKILHPENGTVYVGPFWFGMMEGIGYASPITTHDDDTVTFTGMNLAPRLDRSNAGLPMVPFCVSEFSKNRLHQHCRFSENLDDEVGSLCLWTVPDRDEVQRRSVGGQHRQSARVRAVTVLTESAEEIPVVRRRRATEVRRLFLSNVRSSTHASFDKTEYRHFHVVGTTAEERYRIQKLGHDEGVLVMSPSRLPVGRFSLPPGLQDAPFGRIRGFVELDGEIVGIRYESLGMSAQQRMRSGVELSLPQKLLIIQETAQALALIHLNLRSVDRSFGWEDVFLKFHRADDREQGEGDFSVKLVDPYIRTFSARRQISDRTLVVDQRDDVLLFGEMALILLRPRLLGRTPVEEDIDALEPLLLPWQSALLKLCFAHEPTERIPMKNIVLAMKARGWCRRDAIVTAPMGQPPL